MKTTIIPVFMLLTAIFCSSVPTFGQNGASSVVYDGNVYTFGGAVDILGQPVTGNDVSIFDPLTGEVTHLQSYDPWPEARMGHTASVYGDKMFVYGGKNAAGVLLNDLWEFDLKNRTWRRLNPSGNPMPRYEHSAAVAGDNLYVIGGRWGPGLSTEYVHSINLKAPDAWAVKMPLPEPLQSSGAWVVNGLVNLFGGYWHDWDLSTPGLQPSYSANTHQFNPATNIWTMPTTTGTVPELADFGLTQDANGNVYVSGGVSYNYDTKTTILQSGIGVFNPITGAWNYPLFTDPLLAGAGHTLSISYKNTGPKSTGKPRLYAIGGVQANGRITRRIVEYDIETRTAREVWTPAGIDESAGPGFSLMLYPNPASASVNLSLTLGRAETLSFPIFDLAGRQVLAGPAAREYTPGTHTLQLNVSELPTGIYTLRVTSPTTIQVRRLVVTSNQ